MYRERKSGLDCDTRNVAASEAPRTPSAVANALLEQRCMQSLRVCASVVRIGSASCAVLDLSRLNQHESEKVLWNRRLVVDETDLLQPWTIRQVVARRNRRNSFVSCQTVRPCSQSLSLHRPLTGWSCRSVTPSTIANLSTSSSPTLTSQTLRVVSSVLVADILRRGIAVLSIGGHAAGGRRNV